MWENEKSTMAVNSEVNFMKIKKASSNKGQNIYNLSNDTIINNFNNDVISDDEDIDDIDEENIFEKSIGDHVLLSPINDTHQLFSNRDKYGKSFINALPLKRILVPKSKSPNIKNHISNRNKKNFKNAYNTLKKNSPSINNIFILNNDFLHCRNCMLIVALNRYGKY